LKPDLLTFLFFLFTCFFLLLFFLFHVFALFHSELSLSCQSASVIFYFFPSSIRLQDLENQYRKEKEEADQLLEQQRLVIVCVCVCVCVCLCVSVCLCVCVSVSVCVGLVSSQFV